MGEKYTEGRLNDKQYNDFRRKAKKHNMSEHRALIDAVLEWVYGKGDDR